VPEADEAVDIEEVQGWAAGLNAPQARIAGPGSLGRSHAGGCWPTCAGLLGNVVRKNGWQEAEHSGERTPDGMMLLLRLGRSET
jgi:hypothetical protein